MAQEPNARLKHFLLQGLAKSETYIYTPVQNQIATLIPTPVEIEIGSGR